MSVVAGPVNWGYVKASDGRPEMWNGYEFTADEYAAYRGEMPELTDVIDVHNPPWQEDRVGDGLYRRAVVNFGLIWYTFVRMAPNRRCLELIVATCYRIDDDDPDTVAARERAAISYVEQFRQRGLLYD